MNLRERLLSHTIPEPNSGCLLWTGFVSPGSGGGYGKMQALGEQLAHRVAWRLFHGEIPAGLAVCHRCDVRSCVNPDHLFIGSNRDNALDMCAKGRWRGSSGKGKHPYGVTPTGSRFRAHWWDGKRHHYAGPFDTADEAHAVAVQKSEWLKRYPLETSCAVS